MIWLAAVAVWGAAEASFFFLVPDILLTAVVIWHGARFALQLAVVAAVCASMSGFGMYLWAARDPVAAHAAMLHVPAVGPDLLMRVHVEFDGSWPLHLFVGAISGVPYKLYAVEAGSRHTPSWLFVQVSFAARLSRFSLTIALAFLSRAVLARLGRPGWVMPAWAVSWCAVYLVYFSVRAIA